MNTHGRAAVTSLAQPGRIGRLELPHRLLMGSMHLVIEGAGANIAQLEAFYLERVRGGAALITTGGVAVNPEGGGDHMYCLAEAAHCDELARLAASVRNAGGRLALQLFHSGRYVRAEEIGRPPVAPSAIASRFTKEEPRAMTAEDIAATREAFVRGAVFAHEAGFAAVEIMASEGYLLNEFVSPLTNRRDDGYGGDWAGRTRLPREIVRESRRALGPEFPLIVRMSGYDGMEGSSTEEETLALARALEQAGADALNIGIGWHESTVPTVAASVPPAAFAPIAGKIRAAVGVPVIAANRIHTPEAAEQVLRAGYADFIAPSRPWLADAAFAQKILAGDRRGLSVCISCNQACLDRTLGRPPSPVGCLVNPRTGREARTPAGPAAQSRKVAVIGGGVAGLEAARAAAERGHRVTLFEAGSELGGQYRLASRVPSKEVFLETLRYYTVMLERLKVTVRLGRAPELADFAGCDHVIVATGVTPHVPADLPGRDLPQVCHYADLLAGRVRASRRIAIIGAGGIGCDVAHFLGATAATEGVEREIHLISRSGRVGRGIGPTTRWVLMAELKRLGVRVERGCVTREILPGAVRVSGAETGGEKLIACDQVVLCTGQDAHDPWSERLRAAGIPCEVVGGAAEARELNAVRAIAQAFDCALKL